MATVTLTTLRAKVREAADMVGSSFVTDTSTSVDGFINDACNEVYDLIVSKYEDYYETDASIAVVAGTSEYNLPADFYKFLSLEVPWGGEFFHLKPYVRRDTPYLKSSTSTQPHMLMYRLKGVGSTVGKLKLLPTPGNAFTATLTYVPLRAQLVAGGDTFEGVNGWEDYVVSKAASDVIAKQEEDPSYWLGRAKQAYDRISAMAPKRDAGNAARVTDMMLPGIDDEWYWPSTRRQV